MTNSGPEPPDRVRLDLDELTRRFLAESNATDHQFRDNMLEFRRLVAEDRDALKWVAAFGVAGLFTAAGPLRDSGSWLVAVAALFFLASILGALGHIFLVDLHASELLAATVDESHDSAQRLLKIRNKASEVSRAMEQGSDQGALRRELDQLTQDRLDAIVRFARSVRSRHRLGAILAWVSVGGALGGLLMVTALIVAEAIGLSL